MFLYGSNSKSEGRSKVSILSRESDVNLVSCLAMQKSDDLGTIRIRRR